MTSIELPHRPPHRRRYPEGIWGQIVRTRQHNRRVRILTLIADGRTSEEIAVETHYSVETIKGYTRDILQELGARNRTHAVALAIRQGLIQ